MNDTMSDSKPVHCIVRGLETGLGWTGFESRRCISTKTHISFQFEGVELVSTGTRAKFVDLGWALKKKLTNASCTEGDWKTSQVYPNFQASQALHGMGLMISHLQIIRARSIT